MSKQPQDTSAEEPDGGNPHIRFRGGPRQGDRPGLLNSTETNQRGAADWGSDFFGTLNEMPAEPVTGIGHILEAMATLPAYHDARQWLLKNLGISQGSSVIEAGCGTGAALPELAAAGTWARSSGCHFLPSVRAGRRLWTHSTRSSGRRATTISSVSTLLVTSTPPGSRISGPRLFWLTPTIWTHIRFGAPSFFNRCRCSCMSN